MFQNVGLTHIFNYAYATSNIQKIYLKKKIILQNVTMRNPFTKTFKNKNFKNDTFTHRTIMTC